MLGTIRELVLSPAVGPDLGRKIEFPIVTLASVVIAWWLVRRRSEPSTVRWWLSVGLIGVATLLGLESTLALGVLGMPLQTYLAGFDLRQGALFPVGLAVMLLAPAVRATMGQRPTRK